MRLAEAYGNAGRPEDGLAIVADALATSETTGAHYWDAELQRLRGTLLLSDASAEREAEACFEKAIDIAQARKAKSLELRAATSLCRLWQRQGKTAEARALLIETHGWFSEGFETADLTEAKALLDELGGGTSRAPKARARRGAER